MIDGEGFRANVGMVVCNQDGKLLWAKRTGNRNAWQFPQGGIKPHETPEQALFRELKEEVGLLEHDVKIITQTDGWLKYNLPKQFQRKNTNPTCIGQKQKWFLLAMHSADSKINLASSTPQEFTEWCWVDYWHPVANVINFKKDVYSQFLSIFEEQHNLYFS